VPTEAPTAVPTEAPTGVPTNTRRRLRPHRPAPPERLCRLHRWFYGLTAWSLPPRAMRVCT
jgi:hypothetical protein